jgi:RNA polymerase sigma factor (sigma-70 family)
MTEPACLPALALIDADAAQRWDRPARDKLFRKLVADHQPRLYRFVLRHIGHPNDAEDIAQQAFVEAARTIERFRGESELSTWLYGIALNLVKNWLSRSPRRNHVHVGTEELDEMPSGDSDPSELLSRQQTMRRLVESMAELPQAMQEVLMLVAVDELSYEDAAAILSVPVGTVRSRLSRARALLKEHLTAGGVDTRF